MSRSTGRDGGWSCGYLSVVNVSLLAVASGMAMIQATVWRSPHRSRTVLAAGVAECMVGLAVVRLVDAEVGHVVGDERADRPRSDPLLELDHRPDHCSGS